MLRRFATSLLIILFALMSPAIVGAAAPVLREVLAPVEYAKRLEQALKEIGNWKALSNSNAPIIGMRLTEIFPGLMAEQLGLEAGDVIVEIDHEVYWGGHSKLKGNQQQELKVYSTHKNEILTEPIRAERLGIKRVHYWRPDLAFLRGPQRSPKFDQSFVVAALVRGTDPDLAETALQQAVQAGYKPDNLSHQIALEIALIQNRPDVAREYADLLSEQFEKDSTVHPILILRSALANGQFSLVHRIVSYQDRFRNDEGSLEACLKVQEWAERMQLASKTHPISLEAKIQEMFSINNKSMLQGTVHRSILTRIPQLIRGETLPLQVPVGSVDGFAFQPVEPVLSFDTSMSVTITADDNAVPNPIYNRVTYAINSMHFPMDLHPEYYRPKAAGIDLHGSGMIVLQCANQLINLEIFDSSLRPIGEPNVIRFIRIGPRMEAHLNGHRILLVPASDKIVRLYMEATVSGVSAEFSRLEFVELVERAPE